MVALNIQKADDYTHINRVFFLENGGKSGGYLLKPAHMRSPVISKNFITIHEFKLSVISCQLLSNCLIGSDFELEIYFRGLKQDEEKNKKVYRLEFFQYFIHPIIQQKFFEDEIVFRTENVDFSFVVFKIRQKKQ